MSREHFVSKTVLKRLEQLGGLGITGVPWTPPWPLRSNALTAKVLCISHNEALSALDAEAGLFFTTICDVVDYFRATGNEPRQSRVFSGDLLQRWMLKVLCGSVASNHARDASGNIISPRCPPSSWLRMLYGQQPFPRDTGLHLGMPDGSSVSAEPRVSFETLCGPLVGQIAGAILTLSGPRFVLAMWGGARAGTPTAQDKALYRPKFLRLRHGDLSFQLDIEWQDRGDEKGAEFTWSVEADV